MNIQRFTAPTAREALAKARMAFGDGTLILSNRPTAGGVEVMATAEEALSALDQVSTNARPSKAAQSPRNAFLAESTPIADAKSSVEDDAAQLAMSTLSFQDYVRERMLRRRQEAIQSQQSSPAGDTFPAQPPEFGKATIAPAPWNVLPAKKPVPQPVVRSSLAAEPVAGASVAEELSAMKAMIEDRFNTLSWLGQTRQSPTQSTLMLKLIRAGYSPTLSRAILEKLPENMAVLEATRWVMEVLERNLRTDAGASPLHEDGGVFALVGSTGVGKTTTAAKLAGLCAQTYGPSSVGLITLDTYRVGAHDQLRTYGRMMGVVAHLAHDQAALQDLLGLLSGKKMVLIDTAGVAPRDPRRKDLLDVLNLPGIQRLLVLNAGGHGDTLDEVISSFKSSATQQPTILSKVDEAVKLAPALDAAIRHQLILRGVANGQRVPQDWGPADAADLVQASMRPPTKSAFDPIASDLSFFFTDSTGAAQQRTHYDA